MKKVDEGDYAQLKDKLRDLEDRGRRNNLRFDGITESLHETWDVCEEKIKDVVKNNLGLTDIQIERAHRTAATKRQGLPITVVIKLLSYKDKVEILKNSRKFKDTGIYVNEEFCKETIQIRKGLWDEVKRLRDDGKYAVIQYDKIVSREFRKEY